ncbi:hypothetical protein J6590_044995 [Homalodisca vitripennis]|nr:hypothetical protein J6590_044995 [Homalodisca vitripennis]
MRFDTTLSVATIALESLFSGRGDEARMEPEPFTIGFVVLESRLEWGFVPSRAIVPYQKGAISITELLFPGTSAVKKLSSSGSLFTTKSRTVIFSVPAPTLTPPLLRVTSALTHTPVAATPVPELIDNVPPTRVITALSRPRHRALMGPPRRDAHETCSCDVRVIQRD